MTPKEFQAEAVAAGIDSETVGTLIKIREELRNDVLEMLVDYAQQYADKAERCATLTEWRTHKNTATALKKIEDDLRQKWEMSKCK